MRVYIQYTLNILASSSNSIIDSISDSTGVVDDGFQI